jgi:hypothetical protein
VDDHRAVHQHCKLQQHADQNQEERKHQHKIDRHGRAALVLVQAASFGTAEHPRGQVVSGSGADQSENSEAGDARQKRGGVEQRRAESHG